MTQKYRVYAYDFPYGSNPIVEKQTKWMAIAFFYIWKWSFKYEAVTFDKRSYKND